MSTSATSRLFIAVWPDAATIELLAALPRETRPGVRWTAPEQWHVTLRFLGMCREDDALAAFSGIEGFRCRAVLGPRPGRLGAGVLMVPVSGLDALAAAVVRATAGVGEPPDPRPFLGHITLARLHGNPACGLTERVVRADSSVEEIVLVRSVLTSGGPLYSTIARRDLDQESVERDRT